MARSRFILFMTLVLCPLLALGADPGPLIIQAESFAAEKGGAVVKMSGRPGAVGDCLTTWNNAGHELSWNFDVSEAGAYTLVIHIAAGRSATVYREIRLDGQVPAPELARFAIAPTGGFGKVAENWKKLSLGTVVLSKGPHSISMLNLGGDGQDGGANIDYLAFLPTGQDLASLPGGPASTGANIIRSTTLPAFPGAEGAGALTLGGRGGRVYVVTSLEDSGPGTLREAVMANGPRTVTFALSGIINLKSRLVIGNPYITIAGQSAPGEGITLIGNSLIIGTQHVVVRYIRVRMGSLVGGEADAISVDTARNVILDHVSASWSVDETLSVSDSDNVTVQWSIISESMAKSIHAKGSHGYGSLIRMSKDQKVTDHHNFYAHHMSRLPRPGNYLPASEDPLGGLLDFRNNVVYNWGSALSGYNADTTSATRYNFVGNWYMAGPGSDPAVPLFSESSPFASMHISGNAMNGTVPADQSTLVVKPATASSYFKAQPFAVAGVKTDSAAAALQRVLAGAGASLARDSVDLRLVREYNGRTGKIIDSESDVGGYPKAATLQGPLDADKDGMADAWEVKNGYNPASPADANSDNNNDGYTALEDYLNSLVPVVQ